MKTINTTSIAIILLSVLSVSLTSCNQATPDKVVQRTWLNTNNVTARYSPKFFGELRALKAKGNIIVFKENEAIKGTAVEYVNQMVIDPLNESINKVEGLPEKEDTKELIAASLDVFNYGKEIFENEYLDIATMIDEGQPEKAIDAAIEKLFVTHDENMQVRLLYLDELAISYAEKHNIPIQKVNNQPR
ncbi:hypothetical protein [Sinomicrobium weinanense]|uniref:Lipoprotein n=1 Tax=Sinomicrobium weinanense TaxID=2842200 RepID=A0A926JTG2_9FLAO|nr:hypothetical protein [Sinomicrobium weinanense]MBC9797220.1 hypothetical protein [Sinomicrobium weinanense]MBU3125567.1 hypothetical protein [Sinomicrobium weinanense]